MHDNNERVLTGSVAAAFTFVAILASLGEGCQHCGSPPQCFVAKEKIGTLLNRFRLALTKVRGSVSAGGWTCESVEDRMVMREKSPFIPLGIEPGTLGEMVTI